MCAYGSHSAYELSEKRQIAGGCVAPASGGAVRGDEQE